jgi:hypothetical protein
VYLLNMNERQHNSFGLFASQIVLFFTATVVDMKAISIRGIHSNPSLPAGFRLLKGRPWAVRPQTGIPMSD